MNSMQFFVPTTLAGPSLLGLPGEFSASQIVAADSAADQRHALTPPSHSPVPSLLPGPTAPQNSGSPGSSTAGSPLSSRDNAVVLDAGWDEIQDSLGAAWCSLGTLDALPGGSRPTEPVAAGLSSAAGGGAGKQPGNTGGGAFTDTPRGAAAGGGGAPAGAGRLGADPVPRYGAA